MRFLVSGGAGFIGSHLCEKLLQDNHAIICLDDFNDYYDPKIKRNNIQFLTGHNKYRLVEGDILDWNLLEKLFKDEQIDVVVHLAARAGVRPSIREPRLYQKVNVEGTTNLLELSARYHVSKFILASSSSVYGKNEKVPFSETDPVDNPMSPYAATKKACELIAYTYHALYLFSVTCLRFFTVYGPRQRPDMAIHKFTKMILENREIPFYGDGNSQRDYTYIDDIIDGIIKSIQKSSGYAIYNLGESYTIRLKDLICLLENALNTKAKLRMLPVQPGDMPVTYADISKAKKELGYHPIVPVQTGISKFVEWYIQNRKPGIK